MLPGINKSLSSFGCHIIYPWPLVVLVHVQKVPEEFVYMVAVWTVTITDEMHFIHKLQCEDDAEETLLDMLALHT
jgi:hypothetical protein